MKGILKLAVCGIVTIPLLASCRNGETRNAQSWPEWFETATHVLLVDGFDMAGAQPARL